MAKRTALRKAVKWGGLAVSVLLAVALVGSCWYEVGWETHDGRLLSADSGLLGRREGMLPMAMGGGGWYFEKRWSPQMEWWFVSWSAPDDHYEAMPLWIPLLIVAGPTGAAWWADARAHRRQRAGACPACGYDRRGLEAGKVCPECGAASRGEGMAKPDA